MRYRVVAVGKLREAFYRAGVEHYLRRLRPLAPTEVVEVREGRGHRAAVRRAEGEALRAASGGHVVALHEKGTLLTTRDVAKQVGELELAGQSRISFLIGGAEGHDDELLAAADARWSLSPLTFPHDLARLLLLEQLYRVESLRAGHPYHRD